jgi:hypothetical protein
MWSLCVTPLTDHQCSQPIGRELCRVFFTVGNQLFFLFGGWGLQAF